MKSNLTSKNSDLTSNQQTSVTLLGKLLHRLQGGALPNSLGLTKTLGTESMEEMDRISLLHLNLGLGRIGTAVGRDRMATVHIRIEYIDIHSIISIYNMT